MSLHENWYEEKRSAYLYGAMAKLESNLLHRKLFLDLQKAAEEQAILWQLKMGVDHLPVPEFKIDMRTRVVVLLLKIFGTERLHGVLVSLKIRGMSVFTRYHSEHKHTNLSSSNNLRAAVFGVNDGLVSNMSLILGVTGANANHHFIILAGIAGLLSGAFSMGAGEYISVRSQREVFEYQIAIEKKELEEYPEEEMEELSLIYKARGIPEGEAKKLARIMIENPDTALDTLAREELGINPEDMVSPVGAMLSSFFAFAIGALIPLFPFLFETNGAHLSQSIALTGSALFFIGALLSLYTNKNPIISGLRMLMIGVIAGGVTYWIGHLIGVSL